MVRSIKALHKTQTTKYTAQSCFLIQFSFVSFQITRDNCLMHRFTKQGALENKLTVCGDVCCPPIWTRVSLAEEDQPAGISRDPGASFWNF